MQPAIPDTFGDQFGQCRISDRDEAARVNPVRNIAELFWPKRRKIRQHRLLEQVRVELGDAVHAMTAYGGEVSHSYKPRTTLVDKRQPGEPLVIPRELRSHIFEEAMIDLVNDLQVPR